MGISGSKNKLKKGGLKPKGWYKVSNSRWDTRTSQGSGVEFTVFVFDGEPAGGSGETEEVMLFLKASDKISDYVMVEDGQLVSVDKDNEYEIPENSGVGHFFASLTDAGVSNKVMDNIGDKPGGLDGNVIHIIQEPVLDDQGEPKKNTAGYDMSNTVVDKLGTEKDMKSGKTGGKPTTSSTSSSKPIIGKKSKPPVDDDEDEEEEEEEEEVDEDDDEDADDTDDEEEEEEEEDEPAPPVRRGRGRPPGKR